ncbi:MAG: type II CAAX endopeptidase family protein [Pirellulaceae bacterium]|nr:type II CAAX endopeptidase family protein [Pirellulaceae bacterium]
MSLLVTIATYHSQTKAEAARIHLAQEGIESVLTNESIVAMDWLLMNAIGGIKLQVASHDAERAAGYINALEGEQRERLKSQATEFIRFHCSECGQPQQFTGDRRGGVETCTKCGRYIDVPEVSDEQMIEQHLTLEAATGESVRTQPMDGVQRKVSLPMEVGCVLAFAYAPLMLSAMPIWETDPNATTNLAEEMLLLIINALHIVPPILFFMAVSNQPWSKFGISRPKWMQDSLITIGVWLAATFISALTLNLLLPYDPGAYVLGARDFGASELGASDLGASEVATYPSINFGSMIGWGTFLLCLVGLIANSLAEELAMRAYLIPRFEDLFKSTALAVGLSSALFASYHAYQGTENMVAIFFSGVVYGIFFCICRRIWPLVVAHTVSNMLVYMNL